MYSEIFKNLQTTNQRNDLLISLRTIILELDQPNASVEELLNKFLSVKFASAIDSEKANSSPKDFFKELETELENFAVAKLEIGVEPTQSLIDTVCQWFDNNYQEKVLIDLVVDQHVLLGAKISFKGKFFDGSHKYEQA